MNVKAPEPLGPGALNYPGSDLLSRTVTSAVPSALEGLTSVFGMGTGVAPPATAPGTGGKSMTLVFGGSQATFAWQAVMDECNVVKPHGRLVPLG